MLRRPADIANSWWLRLLGMLTGVAVPLMWFFSTLTPGEDAVKIRNGLVAELGVNADFSWSPRNVPTSYLLNLHSPLPKYSAVAKQIGKDLRLTPARGLELGVAISQHLMSATARNNTPIQSDLSTAYHNIVFNGMGYCADFTQVFTGLALAAHLPVRAWSISFEGFGAGHIFNEIYDESRKKWILIDSFHSLYFVDSKTNEPLSVIQVHDRLLGLESDHGPMVVRAIVPERFPFSNQEMAFDYYRRGMPQLALNWGNNVFDYDHSIAVRYAAKISRHVERLVGILIGEYPLLKVYPVAFSHRDFDSLRRTTREFFVASAALGFSTILFGFQLFCQIRQRVSVRSELEEFAGNQQGNSR